MRNLTRRSVTCPETGRTYVVPAGAAGDDPDTPDDGAGDGDGDDSGAGTDGDGDGGDGVRGDDDDSDDSDKGRKGGPDQLRADLARERKRRRDAEKALEEAARANESDTERARREAREEVLEPVRNRVRRQAIRDAARDVGFDDPADALAFLSDNLDELEVDDEELELADPDRVAELVAELAKRKPRLLTDEGRARLEGRTASPAGASSVDGTTTTRQAPDKSSDDGSWLLPRSRART